MNKFNTNSDGDLFDHLQLLLLMFALYIKQKDADFIADDQLENLDSQPESQSKYYKMHCRSKDCFPSSGNNCCCKCKFCNSS